MFLQNFINWIIAFFFNHFQPTISFVKKNRNALNPTRRSDGSLGFDIYTPTKLEFQPGERKVVNTGIIFQFPSYMGMFIWDKSSVALEHCLSVCGGVVDPGYRGCIGIILQNCHPTRKVILSKGSAIAQAVFHLTLHPTLRKINENELVKTARGERGFGGNCEWSNVKSNLNKT